MANMFSTAKAGQFRDTYAEVPFAEIGRMGDKLQRKTEKAQEMSSALTEMMATDAFGESDTKARNEIEEDYANQISDITNKHYSDADQAIRDSRALATKMNASKTRGRLGAIQKASDAHQNNVKTLDSALANSLISTEKYNFLRKKAASDYQGIGAGEDGIYGLYTDVMPAILKEDFREQTDNIAKGWAADRGYRLMHDASGAYYINEDNKRVSEEEVRAGVSDMLRNDTNEAWARQTAQMEMSQVDPNQQSFTLEDGSVVDRQGMEDALVERQYNKASNYGAKKYGYTEESVKLTQDYVYQMKAKGQQTKANYVSAFGVSGSGFVKVDDKNVDDMNEAVKLGAANLKELNKGIAEFTKGKTDAEIAELEASNPYYKDLLYDRDTARNELAEKRHLMAPVKVQANKSLYSNDEGFIMWNKKATDIRSHSVTHKSGEIAGVKWSTSKDNNPIAVFIQDYEKGPNGYHSGLVPSEEFATAMKDIKDNDNPAKLDSMFKRAIDEGLSYDEALKSFGFSLGDKSFEARNFGVDGGKINPGTDPMKDAYEEATDNYQNLIKKAVENTPKNVREHKILTGVNDGKYSSPTAKKLDSIIKDMVKTNLLGLSAMDGRGINEQMKEEYSDWEDESGTYKKDIQPTSGMTAGGKPIYNLSVETPDGKEKSYSMTGGDLDTFMSIGLEMQASPRATERATGTKMVQNATPFGRTVLGAIVQGAGLEEMYVDNKPVDNAMSILTGFKVAGKQTYIRPKKVAGTSRPYYEIVTKDGDKYKTLEGSQTISGTDSLREYLYNNIPGQKKSPNGTGDIALRQRNPGNIRKDKNSFKTFSTMEEGFGALTHQLDLYKSGGSNHTTGNETLLQAMKKYAPSEDNNNPEEYASTIAKRLGISVNDPIKGISTKDWAGAIAFVESKESYKELKKLGLI